MRSDPKASPDEAHRRFREVLGQVVPDARNAVTVYAAASSWVKASSDAARETVVSRESQDFRTVR